MKVVIHLNSDDTSKQSELLGNLKNLKKDDRIEVDDIQVLLNADAVLMTEQGSAASEYLKEKIEEGVTFNVCSNSVENREKVSREDLIGGLEIVESGIGTLNLLQDQGYNYIKI